MDVVEGGQQIAEIDKIRSSRGLATKAPAFCQQQPAHVQPKQLYTRSKMGKGKPPVDQKPPETMR